MDLRERVKEMYSKLLNNHIESWFDKYCSRDICLRLNKIPNAMELRGKDEVLHYLNQLHEDCNYEFEKSFISLEQDKIPVAAVLGKLKLKKSQNTLSVVDWIRLDPESYKITELTKTMDFTKLDDLVHHHLYYEERV